MNLNLIFLSLALPIRDLNFYPEKVDGSHPLIVFKDENTPIIIKYPEVTAEILPYFSSTVLSVLGKNNLFFY